MSLLTRLTLTDDVSIRRHCGTSDPDPWARNALPRPGAGENPRITIVGAGGTGRSHVEVVHVENEQLMTLRDINDHGLESAAH